MQIVNTLLKIIKEVAYPKPVSHSDDPTKLLSKKIDAICERIAREKVLLESLSSMAQVVRKIQIATTIQQVRILTLVGIGNFITN